MLGGAEDGTRVELLTGSMTKAQRTAAAARAWPSARPGIVVGTHALLEEQVQFADLGLVVVDEQHRFGVEQRAALTDKAGTPPHVLVMTATPIPRTVAMTVFGDLETSTLTELPAGRAAIQTTVVPPGRRSPGGSPGSGRGSARRSRRATRPTSCARGSPATSSSRPTERPRRGPRRRAVHGAQTPPRRGRGGRRRALADGPLAGLRVGLAARAAAAPRRRTARCARSPPARSTCWSSTTVIEVGVDVANATDDGAPRRRPVRRLPAAPAARPGRAGRAARAVPAGHAGPRRRLARARAARRRGRDHRRLRAQPGRPRAAPRGRRPRALAVRPALQPARACGCCATRTRSWRPGRPPRRSSTPIPTSPHQPALAGRWRSTRLARSPTSAAFMDKS